MYIIVEGVVSPIGSTGTLIHQSDLGNFRTYDDTYNFSINGETGPVIAPLTLPFNFKFFGETHNQPYFNSNTYLTFGIPVPGDTGFADCCPVNPGKDNPTPSYEATVFAPGIYIGANDNSWNKCYQNLSDKTYTFRYEGFNFNNPTPDDTENQIYELTFYKQMNTDDDIYIQLTTGIFVPTIEKFFNNTWGVSNGVTGTENIFINFNNLTTEQYEGGKDLVANNSYVIQFDSNGFFKKLYSGYHVEDYVPPKPTSTENTTALTLFLVGILVALILVAIMVFNFLPAYTLTLMATGVITIIALVITSLILI